MYSHFGEESTACMGSPRNLHRRLQPPTPLRRLLPQGDCLEPHPRPTGFHPSLRHIPLRCYVDSLCISPFAQGRDSVWRKHVLQTDEADSRWKQVMQSLGVEVIHALSPRTKGKVERSYRWLQDWIVRTCALENLSPSEEARSLLKEEVVRCSNHQVHSTTGEIASLRFVRAMQLGNNLLRPFALPKPRVSLKDVFRLCERRLVNAYRRISLFDQEIRVPNVPLWEQVEVHLVPHIDAQLLELRICWNKERCTP